MVGVAVLVGLSGCSGDSGAVVPVVSFVAQGSTAQGRLVVDPGQRLVASVADVKDNMQAVNAEAVPAKTKVQAKVQAKVQTKVQAKVQTKTGKVRSAAAKRVQVETVSKPVAKAAPKPASAKAAPKPVTKPGNRAAAKPAPVKAITKPATKPAPKPVVKPVIKPVTKPAPPKKPVAATFAAPTVHYSGATCRKTSANTWSITHTWTASGGTYADLGSAQHRITPVTVTGSTRTWTFVTSESGSSAPEVTDAYLGRIIAPIGQASDISQWRSVERQVDMVQVRC